ncbi:murein L,D-transpeptidase catalytic domain-containing protein [Croceibacterium sp. TMG7-5b_MA50]|uniref:murein L,D-transpeptidase catalytic domain-containing protein n=1 Tax=Croceibacterium sp. TMG7-5b_MA50 TaxID=3121290 RepID=UPI0032214299
MAGTVHRDRADRRVRIWQARAMTLDRRQILFGGAVFAATSMLGGAVGTARRTGLVTPAVPVLPPAPAMPAMAAGPVIDPVVPAALLAEARDALDRQGASIKRDRMAIVDFAAASSTPRLHLVNLESGAVRSLLVTHGSGSDPGHSGWTERFSNQHGSNASCHGAFRVLDYYHGKHGRSQRLAGLDPSNSNALDRAIVIHGAWYAEPQVVTDTGKLGRSQGCFAVGDTKLAELYDHLGSDRLLYAAKIA